MTKMTGRSAFLQLLVDEGITHLFGNPGTTELPIMEVVPDFPQLQFVLGLQESVVVGMADGFCRATQRLSAANVHVAPGLGHAMGALYNAKFAGSPIILTAGQQAQGFGLTEPILYEPLVPIAQPLVKWSVDVTRAEDLPRIIHRAAKIALTPPTGPVFISLPGDVLNATADLDMGKPVRIDARTRPTDDLLEHLADRLLAAKRPVIISGHELARHEALAEAAEFAELLGAAVYQETMFYAATFLTASRSYMGSLPRVQQSVNATLSNYDLIICLGADLLRMAVDSPVEPLPAGVPVVHISERDGELGKNYPTEIAIQANVCETLRVLLPRLRAKRTAELAAQAGRRIVELTPRNWAALREKSVAEILQSAAALPIDPRYLIMQITDALPEGAVLVEEALTSSAPLAGLLPQRNSKALFGLSSGGLGFGVPGAVGISMGLPGRPVVALIGDGSAMFGVQAFWTAAHFKLPITFVIANNRSYRILKDRLVSLQPATTFPGMDLRSPEIDYVGLARSFGIPAQRVSNPGIIGDVLREAFNSGATRLIDVTIADGYGTGEHAHDAHQADRPDPPDVPRFRL